MHTATRIQFSQARDDLADILNRVEYQNVRLVITRRTKDAAALISVDDLALLEVLEDRLDEDWAKEAIEKARTEGGKNIPAKKVWEELGL